MQGPVLVANTGHAHPHVSDAIRRCLDRKQLHAYLFAVRAQTDLPRKLVEMAPLNLTKPALFSTGRQAGCTGRLAAARDSGPRLSGQSTKANVNRLVRLSLKRR